MVRISYSNAVGSLMYVMMCTRPDICYAVGMLSRYQSNPGQPHWKAVKWIMRYLNGTIDYSLYYQGKDLYLEGYTNTDWGGDLDERKCTSEYVFLLGNRVISWSNKKQTCVTLSTIEAKFVALSIAIQEIVWLKRFLNHLSVVNDLPNSVIVNCDSQVAIAFIRDPKYHLKTKHIDTRYNFVRDIITQKDMCLESLHKMIVDPFTKPIPRDLF